MTSGTGTCTVKYDQAGDSNYNAAPQVTDSVTAQKANQTISFGTLPDKTFGDPDFTVSATASSGLTVSFGASGQCTVSGTTVHLTGPGSCTITASQTGDGNYNAAADVPQTFQIRSASPVSQITPPDATCSQVKAGTAASLVQVTYTTRGGNIRRTNPTAFFYWLPAHAAGASTFTVDQAITTGNFSAKFLLGSGSNVYTANCAKGLHPVFTQLGAGSVRVTFTAPADGTYYIGVKLSTSAVNNQSVPSPSTVHYELSTEGIASSTSGIDLSKPAIFHQTRHLDRFFWRLRR